MQTSASLSCFAAVERWEMKDSTNSRLAPLNFSVPQKFCGIGLHEDCIEVVLADQKTELVFQARLAVIRSVLRLWRCSHIIVVCRRRGTRKGSDHLDGADADPVGLAKCAIDGPGLSNAQLGAANGGRRVRGICISVPNEAA